jgi:hypothetical protein
VNQTNTFDPQGRVLEYDFHPMATLITVRRDEKGDLVEATWVDKMSGERTVYWTRGTDATEEQPAFEMGAAVGSPGETRSDAAGEVQSGRTRREFATRSVGQGD